MIYWAETLHKKEKSWQFSPKKMKKHAIFRVSLRFLNFVLRFHSLRLKRDLLLTNVAQKGKSWKFTPKKKKFLQSDAKWPQHAFTVHRPLLPLPQTHRMKTFQSHFQLSNSSVIGVGKNIYFWFSSDSGKRFCSL